MRTLITIVIVLAGARNAGADMQPIDPYADVPPATGSAATGSATTTPTVTVTPLPTPTVTPLPAPAPALPSTAIPTVALPDAAPSITPITPAVPDAESGRPAYANEGVIYRGSATFESGPLPAPLDADPLLADVRAGYVCDVTGAFWSYVEIENCRPAVIHGDTFDDSSQEVAASIRSMYPEPELAFWTEHGWKFMSAGLVMMMLFAIRRSLTNARRRRKRALEQRKTQFQMSAVDPSVAEKHVAAWERLPSVRPVVVRTTSPSLAVGTYKKISGAQVVANTQAIATPAATSRVLTPMQAVPAIQLPIAQAAIMNPQAIPPPAHVTSQPRMPTTKPGPTEGTQIAYPPPSARPSAPVLPPSARPSTPVLPRPSVPSLTPNAVVQPVAPRPHAPTYLPPPGAVVRPVVPQAPMYLPPPGVLVQPVAPRPQAPTYLPPPGAQVAPYPLTFPAYLPPEEMLVGYTENPLPAPRPEPIPDDGPTAHDPNYHAKVDRQHRRFARGSDPGPIHDDVAYLPTLHDDEQPTHDQPTVPASIRAAQLASQPNARRAPSITSRGVAPKR